MRKIILFIFLLTIIPFFGADDPSPKKATLSASPEIIYQGDPFQVQINGLNDTSSIKKLTFDGKSARVLMYKNIPTSLIGVDLNKKAGTYELRAEFWNGNIVEKSVLVGLRDKIEAPLGIPEKLGGNTSASADKLIATLNEDNKSLVGIETDAEALWSEPFIPPLKQIFVTAPYGNSRKTGVYSIPHKGVDYRAPEGTEIVAINRGVVRITETFRNHGQTIVIDHGKGLQSYYLHLSKINVREGDLVERGQVIGLSGASGYTLGAHLHFSVRINDISIDPEKFLKLFQ